MKIILLIICLTTSFIYSQTGWQQLPSGTSAYLSCCYFSDTLTGYVGGQNGYLSKTTDGGATWITLPSGMSGFIREIEFINADTGYFVGDNGNLKKTTNGGASWTLLPIGTTASVYSISIPAPNNIYACTFTGLVLKSTDGGSTWATYTASTNMLMAIDFKSIDTGYVAGQGGVVYKTTDGAINWTLLNLVTVANFWDIHAFDNENVLFPAYQGVLRKTTNGGTDFISQYVFTQDIESISFPDTYIGYFCSVQGNIYKTVDGGKIWFQTQTGTSGNLSDIFFINSRTGFAVGSNGMIIKTTNGGDNFDLALLSPNGGEILVNSTSQKITWSTAINGTLKLEYSTDSGNSWNIITASVSVNQLEYDWNIPSINSAYCRVRIVLNENNMVNDESDQDFIISPDYYIWQHAPEILYYKFNKGTATTPNYAVPGDGAYLAQVIGHTIQAGGFADSVLVGGGGTGSDHYVSTDWAAALPSTGWTIGFWVSNIALGANPNNAVYIFGDVTANNFRCYYGGSGGVGTSDTAIMIRGNGLSDIRVPVVGGGTYYIHYVYDPSSSSIKVYNNGVLSVTTPQSTFRILGSGPFKIGAHSTFASSLSQFMQVDEFRIYNRILDENEISLTWNKTLPYISQITPVELISFTANVSNNAVTLNWVTSTESNNKGFEVQRGVRSHESDISIWEKIGDVAGSGTSMEYKSYSFTDDNIASGSYSYRLKQIDYNGTYEYSPEVEVVVASPDEFYLSQNYPNPFNPVTSIQYAVSRKQLVTLKVYDVLGNEIAKLVDEEKPAGVYEQKFNASKLSSGVYFYKLQADDFTDVKKMMIIK